MLILYKAIRFANIAHHGQVRKYTLEPYINHPLAVAEIIENYAGTWGQTMLCAAVLHDTVEDTETTIDEIFEHFSVG